MYKHKKPPVPKITNREERKKLQQAQQKNYNGANRPPTGPSASISKQSDPNQQHSRKRNAPEPEHETTDSTKPSNSTQKKAINQSSPRNLRTELSMFTTTQA